MKAVTLDNLNENIKAYHELVIKPKLENIDKAVKISEEEGNTLSKKEDGLYVESVTDYNELTNKPVVDSTYSPTGTNAINGVALAAALQNYLQVGNTIELADNLNPNDLYEGIWIEVE